MLFCQCVDRIIQHFLSNCIANRLYLAPSACACWRAQLSVEHRYRAFSLPLPELHSAPACSSGDCTTCLRSWMSMWIPCPLFSSVWITTRRWFEHKHGLNSTGPSSPHHFGVVTWQRADQTDGETANTDRVTARSAKIATEKHRLHEMCPCG